MSSKKVPASSGGSLKEIERKRRQVFKPILDNPYTQTNVWPFVEPEKAESVMGMLSVILSNLGKYNGLLAEARASGNSKFIKPESPEILKSITIGFNSTVKALEEQAQRNWLAKRTKQGDKQKPKGDGLLKTNTSISRYMKYIFVTKYDITPTILTNPLPVLCYTASRPDSPIKLVQLPRGSMARLSSILNLEYTGIIGLADDIRQAQALYEFVEKNIGDISIPWLADLFAEGPGDLVKPNLKFLVTSAPILPKKNDQKKKNDPKKNGPTKNGEERKEEKENKRPHEEQQEKGVKMAKISKS